MILFVVIGGQIKKEDLLQHVFAMAVGKGVAQKQTTLQ
jgi:hypothetical protein